MIHEDNEDTKADTAAAVKYLRTMDAETRALCEVNERPSILKISYLTTVLLDNRVSISYNCFDQ